MKTNDDDSVSYCGTQLTKITTCKNALHRMIGRVAIRSHTILVAGGAGVIIEADETLVPSAAEIAFHTGITADSCGRSVTMVRMRDTGWEKG